jgi:hypothetical protein
MTTTLLRAALLSTLLMAGAAHAQSVERGGTSAGAIPPVSEAAPTGASPGATGSITATGRTKPPGAPVGEGMRNSTGGSSRASAAAASSDLIIAKPAP